MQKLTIQTTVKNPTAGYKEEAAQDAKIKVFTKEGKQLFWNKEGFWRTGDNGLVEVTVPDSAAASEEPWWFQVSKSYVKKNGQAEETVVQTNIAKGWEKPVIKEYLTGKRPLAITLTKTYNHEPSFQEWTGSGKQQW